jgi:hypothetical protein
MSAGPARHDFQLLFIGLALGGGLLTALLSSLPLTVGGGVGSLLAGVAVVDGLALKPPRED